MPKLPTRAQIDAAKPAKHPAKFTDSILSKLDEIVPSGIYLDPFSGTGKVRSLERVDRRVIMVEIEEEWASQAPGTICADSLEQMRLWDAEGRQFDGVVTSCHYGNRMSDHHVHKDSSRRHSYQFDLGRPLSEGNIANTYFWQPEYREFYLRAWNATFNATRRDGCMFLNVKNFIRNHREVRVVGAHLSMLKHVGYAQLKLHNVETPGLRDGENGDARVDHEVIIEGRKP